MPLKDLTLTSRSLLSSVELDTQLVIVISYWMVMMMVMVMMMMVMVMMMMMMMMADMYIGELRYVRRQVREGTPAEQKLEKALKERQETSRQLQKT